MYFSVQTETVNPFAAMASHYRLYDGMGEVIPFNARYSYPTQANRTWKSLIKIPSKNGSVFRSNQNPTIRIELPAQAYLNTASSFLQFDLAFNVANTSINCHLQNNAQSWIKRARWVYGSLVGEDIRDYNIMVRKLTEGTGTNNTGISDQTTLSEGVGGIRTIFASDGTVGALNVRNYDIQSAIYDVTNLPPTQACLNNVPRRYQVSLALGLFQQNKLLPLKWMASQVALEFEMADFDECCCHSGPPTGTDYYTVSNVNFVADLVEFDGTYDAAFLEGLRNGGVPIKFNSWDTFMFTPAPSDKQILMIPERNRSIKAAFCVQLPPRRPAGDTDQGTAGRGRVPWDSHAFLESSQNLSTSSGTSSGWLVNYQWRVGGKYYPSQAVQCGDTSRSNGGVEAYSEFAKALNIVGDYRLSTAVNTTRWVRCNGDGVSFSSCVDWLGSENPGIAIVHASGPSCFVISADFETTSGEEVSGLNGEEQNDIALMIQYSGPQTPLCNYDVFVYYDALLILRDNNLVELIK